MARRPKIWTALAPATLSAAAAFLLAFASPGVTASGGTSVVIPLTDSGWSQLAETHASDASDASDGAAGEGVRFLLSAGHELGGDYLLELGS